ncbi:MAG: hypothetical protein DWQ37_03240 [Planctomycetota bacterium]|nr:MAG: hypothetical protein DWQ37_03240 [Planctomycetota bacterium]
MAGLGALWLVAPAGCAIPAYTAKETQTDVFETGPTPKIVVDTFNGSIDISNGAEDEVVVEVTKRASGMDEDTAAANLANIEIAMEQRGDEIHITARRLRGMRGNFGASVIVAAPPEAVVELKTDNGYIVSEGMRGGVEARTSNGRIDVVEATGPINARTSNSAIQIEAEDAVLEARTSNGRVRFRGSLADARHRVRTSNGKLDSILPEGSVFRFDASTSNGRVDCEFPFDRTDSGRSRRNIEGLVGDGPTKTELVLDTSNSSIDIRRIDDSKQLLD